LIAPNYIQDAASVFSLRICGALSLWKPDAPQRLDEARLGAQAVQVRSNADNQRVIVALGMALIRHVERALLISQAGVCAGLGDRRDAPPTGFSLQLHERLAAPRRAVRRLRIWVPSPTVTDQLT
jgi:hypothetical protein